ncbi:MAG TPA: hypothetical protein VM327_07540 [Candidatus Thermoplasmatota archaeon]|nr:hypothetical protein [Candidatus Thermoplasmatota archaeon]
MPSSPGATTLRPTPSFKARLTGPWTFPAVQQSFDLYVTVFYRGHAPEGWSLVNGDT